jgi:hypothetical protein
MARWRIDCRDADWLLSRQKDERLARAERWALWWHLRFCDSCRTVRRNLEFLSRVIRRMDAAPPAPPGVSDHD